MAMGLIRAVVNPFGLMGGAMQAQGHAQLLLNLLVFGMDIQQAIDAAPSPGRDERGDRSGRS